MDSKTKLAKAMIDKALVESMTPKSGVDLRWGDGFLLLFILGWLGTIGSQWVAWSAFFMAWFLNGLEKYNHIRRTRAITEALNKFNAAAEKTSNGGTT